MRRTARLIACLAALLLPMAAVAQSGSEPERPSLLLGVTASGPCVLMVLRGGYGTLERPPLLPRWSVTAVDLRIGIAVGVGIAIGIERIDLAMAVSPSIPIPIATPTPNAPSSPSLKSMAVGLW